MKERVNQRTQMHMRSHIPMRQTSNEYIAAINTLRQHGRQYLDDIFKYIFIIENH